ncbi:hypothetical protein [Mycolicibacterium nivoides]|jgi:hypothetical protein|uniref:Transposase n=1 Tax=Mycolicibacterium nivoides TaxID=2487344 RepID=A0ABW9LJV9_9MYCO|nr:hypothetical protein [Mycolicibacterium nivoides]MBN3511961.1 hypothetical protein [Mycolicibacterium septicum]SER77073.1 hypothetical protein SAMN04488583_6272 [Mycobacterium sp. 88mf]SFG47147.1 hypothetical protein SAMN04488582_10817 [Mycobacterium sp. 455mf]
MTTLTAAARAPLPCGAASRRRLVRVGRCGSDLDELTNVLRGIAVLLPEK